MNQDKLRKSNDYNIAKSDDTASKQVRDSMMTARL